MSALVSPIPEQTELIGARFKFGPDQLNNALDDSSALTLIHSSVGGRAIYLSLDNRAVAVRVLPTAENDLPTDPEELAEHVRWYEGELTTLTAIRPSTEDQVGKAKTRLKALPHYTVFTTFPGDNNPTLLTVTEYMPRFGALLLSSTSGNDHYPVLTQRLGEYYREDSLDRLVIAGLSRDRKWHEAFDLIGYTFTLSGLTPMAATAQTELELIKEQLDADSEGSQPLR